MNTKHIRLSGTIIVLLTFLTGVSGGMLFTHRSDSKVQELLNEKLKSLQKIVAQMETLQERREMATKDLYDARVALCRTRSELCSKDDEKIAVLEEILELAKHREATIKELPKTVIRGIPEEAMSLKIEQAKVDRLDIEIELQRLKSK